MGGGMVGTRPRPQPPRAGLPAHVCGVPAIPRETPVVEPRRGREAAGTGTVCVRGGREARAPLGQYSADRDCECICRAYYSYLGNNLIMRRRARKLLDLVPRNDVVEEKKVLQDSTNVPIDMSNRIDSPVPSGCEQEIKFLLQVEAEEFLQLNNNNDLPDFFVTIEEETEHVEVEEIAHKNKEKDKVQEKSNDVQLSPLNNVVELPIAEEIMSQEKRVQRQNCVPSSPKNSLEGPEVLEDEMILSRAANTTIDCPMSENLSILTTDLNFNSPTSSFTIPSPLSSAVSSPVGSPLDCSNKRRSGKVRTRNYTEWKDLKRKALKNSGKPFINKMGRAVSGKKIKEPCNCPKKCFEKIEESCREHVFNCFWDIGSHEKQWDFIVKYTRCHKPKRIKAEGPNRTQTRIYNLPINKTETVQVCRKMFLNTLSISEKTVRTAFMKVNTSMNEHRLSDLRGRHLNRPKKIKEAVVDSVKNHIDSLAPVESHYCRKNSTKKYLDGQLSYKRLHNLYTEWFLHENYDCEMASLRQYQDIVNKNFNIAFYHPKKDQCDKCHAFFCNKEPTDTQKREQDLHMQRKNFCRTVKAADKAEAERNSSIIVATFDMQKILTCPFGNVSIFYYKRKLNLYNFTVYDVAQKSGYCYMWTEVFGKKGANEISSGLNLFIKTKIDDGAKIFRFWSDNCSGQNRNRIVFAFYQHVLEKFDIESITHRFLEVGHTQNEGDSVHSVIEGVSNRKTIYTPDQWVNLIRWAKTTGEAYRVKEMALTDIFNYRSLLNGKNWTKNDDGEKVVWSKIKEVHITKENYNVIKYKYDLNEEYDTMTTLKKSRRGKKTIPDPEVQLANTTPLKVKYDKYKDLMSMCDSKIIPDEFHSFFRGLPYEQIPLGNDNNTESTDEEDDYDKWFMVTKIRHMDVHRYVVHES
ncbi:unnamed protein product [Chilo suppressalis]|uniref:DUF7869 domain-containing protein n=1 Tax=Chilo suppressalis TaxID=168631 RepID=A0ABN8EAR6_CHISP|nr:unnamed protein product [Chilo suppressalis]